ncbi:unnamed protein product [Cylicocyclus nassatus]|uniref:Uncharacterized protein n=1 Tax=Cylicocyclus nassatus TaxID=53992 RepID=A0AA36H6A2_CYLNA|nr:unnamed protein product [Cylicocyclus nassatus]
MRSSLVFLFSSLLISSAVAAKLGKREADLQNSQEAGTTSDHCDCALACPPNNCALECPPNPDPQSSSVKETIPPALGHEDAPPAQQVAEQSEDANLGFLLN